MNVSFYIPGSYDLGRINHKDHEAQCGSPWMFHFFKFELLCLKWKCDGLEIEQVIYITWRELQALSRRSHYKRTFSAEKGGALRYLLLRTASAPDPWMRKCVAG